MSASRWIELHPNKFSPPKEDVTPDLEEGVSGAGRSVRSQGGLSSMYW